MPREIPRDEVRRVVAANAQFVDVLPRAEYDAEHIAGAINIPLRSRIGFGSSSSTAATSSET